MRTIVLLMLTGLLSGCGAAVAQRTAPSETTGMLTDSSGKAVGNVMLTLQPLEDGHLAPLQVAPDGSFKGELVPGKYAYFVGKSSAKNSEIALKSVEPKFHEASLDRTVEVKPGEALKVVLQ
jgi:hypothetical protein